MTISPGILSVLGLMFSFLIVYVSVPRIASKLRDENIVGRDMLKTGNVMVPESGGIVIVLAVVASVSVMTYLFVLYAYPTPLNHLPPKAETQVMMLSAVSTILAVGFIGLTDDYLNIPQKYKLFLPLFAALPLSFAFMERSIFWVPFLGYIRLGMIYPIVLIPVGVAAASNLTNMYSGLNGLDVGAGLIACSFTALTAAIIGRWSAVIILAPMVGSLAAFLVYNKLPAKIFPGDVGALVIGASLAVASIVGFIKIIAVIALMPHIVNFLQYMLRIRFFVANPDAKFATLRQDGTLRPPKGGEWGSLYFTTMNLFRRNEKWHVHLHWAICVGSGLLALIVGILIHGTGVHTF